MAARDQAAEGERIPHLVGLLVATAVKSCLQVLLQFSRDDRLVGTVVGGSVEFRITTVDAVAHDLADGGDGRRNAALAICEAIRPSNLRDLLQQVLPGGVLLKPALEDPRQVRVGRDGPLGVGAVHVEVAQRCT